RGATLAARRRGVAGEACAPGDDPACGVRPRARRLLAEIFRVVLAEVLTPAGANQHAVALAHVDALRPGGVVEMLGRDFQARWQWIGAAVGDVARDVEKHGATDHEVHGKAIDAELVADPARRRGRGD